ncbi:MAG: DUF4011 domain-containing protein [Metamycoplasma hominis]|nr:DUF4011 domain-containing protein [Metamycoplasma hominis]
MENKELITKTLAYESLKNKLLDTTLRNILINYKKNKSSTITIEKEDIKSILDKIENRSEFKFIGSQDSDDDIEVESNEFLSSVSQKELLAILSLLQRKQKTLLEEQGINILYLAFGGLQWKDKTEKNVYSPLLFLPVSIESENGLQNKKIIIQSNDFVVNNSLIKKLNDDFGLDIKFEAFDNVEGSLYDRYSQYIEFINQKINSFNDSIEQNWKIVDEASLSAFRFSSMDIYLDVDKNKDNIINSEIMNAMTGINNVFSSEYLYSEEEVDNIVSPKGYYHCLMTNSSQEAAIQSAIKGNSFIIQGPPGTGKSQTIANIISELIARNKKVLFVAEKKAALDVVYKSIQNLGFANFILLIHSNNSNKKDFSNDLYETLQDGQKFKKVSDEVIANNDYLYSDSLEKMNDFVRKILSNRKPLGRSLYLMIGDYQKLLANTKGINFDIKDFEKIDNAQFVEIQSSLNKFNLNYKNINFNAKESLWYGLSILDVKLQDLENIKEISSHLINEIQSLINFLDLEIPNNYQPYIKNSNYSLFNSFFKIFSNIQDIDINPKYLEIFSYNKTNATQTLNEILLQKEKIQPDIDWILSRYNQNIFNSEIYKNLDFVKSRNNIFKRIFSKRYRAIKKELKINFISSNLNYKNLLKDLEALNNIQLAKNAITLLTNKIPFSFKENYNEMDLNSLKQQLNIFSKYEIINNQLSELKFDQDLKISFFNFLLSHIQLTNNYINSYKNLMTFEDKFNDYFNNKYVDYSNSNYKVNDFIKKLNFLIDSDEYPEAYCSYIKSRQELKNNPFTNDFVDAIELLDIDCLKQNSIENIFNKRFYQLLIDYYLSIDLADWNDREYEKIINVFKNSCLKLNEIAKFKIIENLSNNLPTLNSTIYNDELEILKKEYSKVRNKKPIRKLFKEIPNLIQNIKPCFMMSPSSLSTYLADSSITFDSVIFDEASQLTTENALISMIKAKQIIIAGDINQLPPTNFFKTMSSEQEPNEDEEIVNEENDYDSLLERMQSSFRQVTLKWHYRSKFEELILPSNKFVYDNKLITFPTYQKTAKKDGELLPFEGVSFIKVNGIYEDQTNEIEANRIIELIKQLKDYYGNTKTFGVVTFNLKQANLIDHKLFLFMNENPEYMDLDTENKIFVKNIESVQGDERDIIILGITNSWDKNGRLSRFFGPLNNVGGEKRLNVAISRAKEATIVVSSISYSDLKVDDLKNEGLRFLKQYLQFAEFGYDSKSDDILQDDTKTFDSEFEIQVYDELKKLGYKVNTQVGCSKFKIDLAIVDDKNPSKYILGIECDGATYHSSKSARDRDAIRQMLLESRGWIIHRIWSLNWFKNKRRELEKIVDKVNQIKQKKFVVKQNEYKTIENSQFEIIEKRDNFNFEEWLPFNYSYRKTLNFIEKSNKRNPLLNGYEIVKQMFNYGHTYREKEINKMIKDIFVNLALNKDEYTYKFLCENSINYFVNNKMLEKLINPDGEIFYHDVSKPNTFRMPKDCDNRKISEISSLEMFDLIKQVLNNSKSSILKNNLTNTILKTLLIARTENNISKLNDLYGYLNNLGLIKVISNGDIEYIDLNNKD